MNTIFASLKTRDSSLVTFEDIVVDVAKREVYRSNIYIRLSNKEFNLLIYFINNPSKVLSRMDIFEAVWDRNGTLLTNTVDVHVMNLRRKLDLPFCKPLILTVHCVGYRFG